MCYISIAFISVVCEETWGQVTCNFTEESILIGLILSQSMWNKILQIKVYSIVKQHE